MSIFSNRAVEYANGERYWCSECGNPCDPIVIDDGIGPYEYFGMKGVDRRPALVSNCCEADPLDEAGHSIQLSDLEPPEC